VPSTMLPAATDGGVWFLAREIRGELNLVALSVAVNLSSLYKAANTVIFPSFSLMEITRNFLTPSASSCITHGAPTVGALENGGLTFKMVAMLKN